MKPLHIGYFADGPWGHGAFHKIMEDETLEMDFVCIRYGQQDKLLAAMAKEKGIAVMTTNHRMFTSCGLLFQAGLDGGVHIK